MAYMLRIGHRLAISFLAVIAVWMLVKSAQSFPTLLSAMHHSVKSSGATWIFFPAYFVAWLPVMICAWGIWNWRRWGQALTIAFCALGVFLELAGLILFGRAYFHLLPLSLSLLAVAMIVWLLLPSVRVQFHD